MEGDDYSPIDCGLYSHYELAIMHRARLRLTWRDASGETHIGIVTPLDLRTRRGAEFMIATQQDGTELEIRLDRITSHARVQRTSD